ncbi:hypothetical protein [Amycolatopsis palatopharyngis]|uniref:hypothetical protein n=1 Tax=Amycolatopsis palatopharyngis TaxID=187982 RepID=UPI0013BE8C7A|nr:hypothetical protein [Amycolatopsis palatopharyngis]
MQIYTPQVSGYGDWVTLDDHNDRDRLRTLGCNRVDSDWVAPRASLVREIGEREVPLVGSRMPWLSSWTLALRDEAIDDIAPLLRASGELLPLSCPEGRLVALHVTEVMDVLDEDGSTIIRHPEHIGGRIITIEHYSFVEKIATVPPVFNIPQQLESVIFFRGDVVQKINDFCYGGTVFERVA